MAPEDLRTLIAFFKTLADESRLRILGILATGERTVGELAEILGLREPTVSHHLGKLRALGLVAARAEGTARVHRLDPGALERLAQDVLKPDTLARLVPDSDPGAWERKVLAAFVDGDERLTRIPASRKKRDVILRWLVQRFEPDRDYPEREVNAIIGRHHEDFATLRRELVGLQLMTRSAGVYRRVAGA